MRLPESRRFPLLRDQSVTVFLSIYLLVLVFFVMLTALSNLEQKSKQAHAESSAGNSKFFAIRQNLLSALAVDVPHCCADDGDFVFSIPIESLFISATSRLTPAGVDLLRTLASQAQAPVGVDVLIPAERGDGYYSDLSLARAVAAGAVLAKETATGRVRVGLSHALRKKLLVRFVLATTVAP